MKKKLKKAFSFLKKFNYQEPKNKYLVFVIFFFIMKFFDALFSPKSLFFSMAIGSFACYLLITLAIGLLILGIFNNAHKGVVFLAYFLLVIFFINFLKSFFDAEPFYLSDLLILKDGPELVNFLTPGPIIVFILRCALIGIIITYIYRKLFKYTREKLFFSFFKKLSSRLIAIFISLLISFVLIYPQPQVIRFILNNLYASTIEDDYQITFRSSLAYYQKLGLILGTHQNIISSYHFKPESYNKQKLLNILKNYENQVPANQALGTPNIIVVFSESYWNPELIKEVKFSSPVLPNYESLSNVGQPLNLISPSFGGLSANVEFELLTGLSIKYFSGNYIPYVSLYKNDKSALYPSLIKEMQQNGYQTEILNTAGPKLYDCQNVYKIMDLDKVTYVSQEPTYAKDSVVTDMIKNRFNSKAKNEKLFYLAITMGSHMPYYENNYQNPNLKITSSPYSNSINNIILNYALAVNAADQELGKLYEYINTLEEPTLLIYFGDHLPFLKTEDNAYVFEKINMFTKDVKALSDKYTTPAIVLSNYDTANFSLPDTLSPDLFLNYILNNTNLSLSAYYRWLYDNQANFAIGNNYVSKKDSDLYFTNKLPTALKKYELLRANMQYLLLYD